MGLAESRRLRKSVALVMESPSQLDLALGVGLPGSWRVPFLYPAERSQRAKAVLQGDITETSALAG
jgi:hypothetical protein